MTSARKNQPGTASRVGGSVRNTAAQFLMKNRSEEFSDIIKYNAQFQGKIKTFASIAENIAQERFCKRIFEVLQNLLYLSYYYFLLRFFPIFTFSYTFDVLSGYFVVIFLLLILF